MSETVPALVPAQQEKKAFYPWYRKTSSQGSSQVSNDVSQNEKNVTPICLVLGIVASLGGFIFGYESGQISGFLQMSDFQRRFSDGHQFEAVRAGTIVALLCAGTLIGCLASGWIVDRIGRRYTISSSSFFYIAGVIIEITSMSSWAQFAMGRFTAGLGIGALSTSVPMYQAESIPKRFRSVVGASFQFMITFGIFLAYIINFTTDKTLNNSAQWRITVGLSAVWGIILGVTILFLPESPRYAYRKGRLDEARRAMARIEGLDDINDPLIDAEIDDIQKQMEAENTGADHPWYEIFTGPAMLRRTLLGMGLQAGQQLTGANFFFYYGTTIFRATGISNSFITSIILGAVNLGATVASLWIIKKVGRRPLLMIGAAWMCVCFLIYSFIGHFEIPPANPESAPTAGAVLIVFTCLFIVAFAITWGPLVWAVISELYPPRYRGHCMALATASNWLLNFLISFFTTFITNKINYFYGLVFAACCFALFFVVYFFMMESQGFSLEEIDQMYVQGVDPRKSASWKDPLKQAQSGVSTGSEPAPAANGEMRNRSQPEVANVEIWDSLELNGDNGQVIEDVEMQTPARNPSRLGREGSTSNPNPNADTAPLQ